MQAIICDRCGAVLKGQTEPFGVVSLAKLTKEEAIGAQAYQGLGTYPAQMVTVEKEKLTLQLCRDCHDGVRALLTGEQRQPEYDDLTGEGHPGFIKEAVDGWYKRAGGGHYFDLKLLRRAEKDEP